MEWNRFFYGLETFLTFFFIFRPKVDVPKDETRFVHNALTRRIDSRCPEGSGFFFPSEVDFGILHFSDFGPRPWAGTRARVRVPDKGRGRVPNPGSSPSPGPGSGSRHRAQNPKNANAKIIFRQKKISRTFQMARIDPSRQGVMSEASFVLGDINFWPKN